MTAQSPEWASAGMPLFANQVRCIYTDTTDDVLYVSGQILGTVSGFSDQRICKYDGSNWSNIGVFNNLVLSMVNYNGDLIVAGVFTTINSVPFFSIARYDGSSWFPMGNFDMEVTQLKVINSDLYAMGYFNSIGTVPAKRIAKWNGTVWSDVNGFSADTMDGHINDIAIYNGNTYVCGNFVNTALGINHLAVYKGGSWQNVGGGILGAWTDLSKMIIYQNQLHLLGCIVKPANIGNGIQKWNDTVWTEVGAGLQDFTNSYGSPGTVSLDGVVHNNELYVAGSFGNAGFAPGYSLSKWDGLKWCGLATTGLLNNKALAINFYNDTLYLGISQDTLNGVFVNRVIKYIAGNYTDTCSINYTGITNLSIENEIILYPNPSSNQITLEFELNETKNVSLEIKNVLGQMIKTIPNNTFIKGKNKIEIEVNELSNGVYFIQLQNGNKKSSQKFLKY